MRVATQHKHKGPQNSLAIPVNFWYIYSLVMTHKQINFDATKHAQRELRWSPRTA